MCCSVGKVFANSKALCDLSPSSPEPCGSLRLPDSGACISPQVGLSPPVRVLAAARWVALPPLPPQSGPSFRGTRCKKVQNEDCRYFVSASPWSSGSSLPQGICPVPLPLMVSGNPACSAQAVPTGSSENLLVSHSVARPRRPQCSQPGLVGLAHMLLPLAVSQRLFMRLCQHLSPKGCRARV